MKNLFSYFFLLSLCVNVYSQQIPGLVACYPFNGNALDMTGNGHNGIVSGATLAADRFNNPNSAYHFNGISDYIAVNHFDSLIPQNELTLSVWAKADISTSNCIFMLSPDNASDRCVACAHYAGGIIWDYGNIFSSGRIYLTGYPFESKWDHYIYITSQSQNLKQIYKNGVLIANQAYGSSLVNRAKTLLIGSGTDSNPGNIRFHGYIDDVTIFNRALTQTEVTKLYNNQYSCSSDVSINDLTDNALNQFSIFPNPYSGFINIHYVVAQSSPVKLEIFNLLGEKVATLVDIPSSDKGTHQYTYTAPDIGAKGGIYFLRLQIGNDVLTKKVIQQN